MLHRFSKFVVACTVLLVLAGSLVTSNAAGLSVPDWPTSYGYNMFAFPPSKWVANILYEHGHRLIASGVGFLTIVLAAWLWIAEPRRWMKYLGASALGAVILQGVLGGLTVLFFLPPAISTAHAGLAEIFFCITIAIALFTSPGWVRGYSANPGGAPGVDDGALRAIATMTTVVIYCQIIIGAWMRHTGAGLAIPDFPLMFGHIIPDHWDALIAIHFAHRTGALVVTLVVLATVGHIWFHHPERRELVRPAILIVGLVTVQITLGALTVLTRRDVTINSLHVLNGALVLTTSLVITLRTWRVKFAANEARVPVNRDARRAADVRLSGARA
ncbi:MAG TPA: COX15/CtaA family protein [Vicinamibacterales bacterium]|jgi:cytochrome c oxidase assembly protein subunit 15|nr:COX15/CtaA family protein [Vicinamibacterales bacterium]